MDSEKTRTAGLLNKPATFFGQTMVLPFDTHASCDSARFFGIARIRLKNGATSFGIALHPTMRRKCCCTKISAEPIQRSR